METKRACDSCRLRKRRCDQKLPICSNCLSIGDCTYSSTQKRGPKKGYKHTLLQRLESLENVLLTAPSNKQVQQLEQHLLKLGLQQQAQTPHLSQLLSENPSNGQNVHKSTTMAFSAFGILYSTHATINSNSKFDFIKSYLKQAENATTFVHERNKIDSLRALLIIQSTHFQLNDLAAVATLANTIHSIVQDLHMFDPCVFNQTTKTDRLFQVDDFFRKPFVYPILTQEQIQERMLLFQEYYFMDTFISMTTAAPLKITQIYNFNALENSSNFSVPPNYSRYYLIDQGRVQLPGLSIPFGPGQIWHLHLMTYEK